MDARVIVGNVIGEVVVLGSTQNKKQKTDDDNEERPTKGGFGIVACWGEADRERGVTSLHGCGSESSRVLVTRKNGGIEVLDTEDGRIDWSLGADPAGHGCASGHWIEDKVLRVMEHGVIQVYSLESQDPISEWTCPPNVVCSDYRGDKLAVGCDGAELKVYSVSDGSLCYAAKGGKPNSVGICDRPCTSAVAFDPSGQDRVIVGTGSAKLRFYDAKAGRRPQRDISFKGYKITCLAPEENGQRCWVGDGGGNLQVYDVRAGTFCGSIRGIGGSVRSLDILNGAIVSGGLDRFLRINSLQSRASIEKVYMKSQLTSVCWRSMAHSNSNAEKKKKRAADDKNNN